MMDIYKVLESNKNKMKMIQDKPEIIAKFAQVINSHSLENDSNTPDFILAEYLFDCLLSAQLAIVKRCVWYNPDGK
jgi:hypothetical protein